MTKLKLLPFGILESGRLLVGEPRRVARIDSGHEAERHRIAVAGRTIELIDHPAGEAGDARTIGGLFEREIVDGAVRRQKLAGLDRRRDENGRRGKGKECNPRGVHRETPVATACDRPRLV